MTELRSDRPTTPTPASPSDRRRSLPTGRRARARRWWRRRPVNRALVLAHRWPALILGLFLVIECTSGSVLLYQGDLFKATNTDLYHHTASAHPLAADQAIALVNRAHPSFGGQWAARDDGVLVVGNPTYKDLWFVDPGTGHINGTGSLDKGFLGLLTNVHDCAFTCIGEPGYNPWLATEAWHDGPSFMSGITRGAIVLGVLGVLLILLALTSLKIWWPGLRKLKHRFTVRRGKGRFARDFDLHNVIGAIGLPFLLMWGITGAAFEFPGIEKGWLAITGGDQHATAVYAVTPNPKTAHAPQISLATATTVARGKVAGTVNFIGLPTKDTPYYDIEMTTGYASESHRAVYNTDAYVYVDAHDATNVHTVGGGDAPAPNRFYDKFLEPTHFGWNVNGWWRILWAVLGLTPLALMITGVSTWLYRRGVKKRRRARGRPAPSDQQLTEELADEVREDVDEPSTAS